MSNDKKSHARQLLQSASNHIQTNNVNSHIGSHISQIGTNKNMLNNNNIMIEQ